VYLLKSKNNNFVYTGFSSDLRKRFIEHNAGKVRSTKFYKPFDLIYYEAYNSKTIARKRELELKNNSQQKEILLKRIGFIEKKM
jgi:putative endonuclease